MILQLFIFAFICTTTIFAQQQQTTPVSIPESLDPNNGGQSSNPGGKIRFSEKALNAIYEHAIEKITNTIKALKLPDIMIPIDGGMLSIKSSKITDVKIPNHNRELLPPNAIRSRLFGGKITSEGQWQYRPYGGVRSFGSGVFRTTVTNAELNMTTNLDRTTDGKPMVQVIACKADLGQFQVEIEGFGGDDSKPMVMNQCDNFLCKRIMAFFEDAVCSGGRRYVTEYINEKLKTFPSKIQLGPTSSNFFIDYRIMACDPVTEQFIQGNLEGEVVSRTGGSSNFHPVELNTLNMTDNKPISFSLSDYAFNTLLSQAHQQQFPFSAYHLLSNDSNNLQLLTLNCSLSSSSTDTRQLKPTTQKSTPSTPKTTTTKKSIQTRRTTTTRKPTSISTRRPASNRRLPCIYAHDNPVHCSRCLGSVFDNETDIQLPMEPTGNLVFKSQRPAQIFVNQQPDKSYFFVRGGFIEVYGGRVEDLRSAKLVFRADVKSMSGEFMPKMDGTNITGSVKIDDLQLTQSTSPGRALFRSISDSTLVKLAEFAKPVLTSMFNSFFETYGQFSVPLVDGYECAQPQFRLSNRTMQIDCDIKVLPHAIRNN